MSGAAKVLFSLSNLTTVVTNVSNGVVFLQGTAERGPFSDPSEIITSWPQFVEKHGGLLPESDTPLLCKRLLEKGGMIRFSRVGHYTDITDPSTLTALAAENTLVNRIEFNETFKPGNIIKVMVGTVEYEVNYTLDNLTTTKKIAEAISRNPNIATAVYKMDGSSQVLFIGKKTGQTVGNDVVITVTGGTTQPVATYEDLMGMEVSGGSGDPIFTIKPKYAGLDANNLVVTVTPTVGVPNSFSIDVIHKTEPMLSERYTNLVYENNNTYLGKLNSSKLVNFEYGTTFKPSDLVLTTILFDGGTDGSVPQLVDYIGDSAGANGLHAFDEYNDSYYLATLDDVDVDIQGVAYCAYRDDMAYIISLSGATKQTLITEKNTKGIDDKHAYFVGGGVKVIDPLYGTVKEVKETADVLAAATASDRNYGPWYSFAGPNRGMLTDVIGVTNNFGAPVKYKDLDELADNNINMVINRDGSTKLWGNYSGQLKNNQERYFNVVKLIFFIKKALRPVLETFLEEPNDIPTWQRMYYTVKPLFDELKDRRAIYSYNWEGDQFATNMANLQINKAVDVTQGKYKAVLTIAAINSIQEISIGIVLTDAGIEFEVNNF